MTNITDTKTHQPVLQKIGWLVVWNMFYFPFHIWDVIRNPLTFVFFRGVGIPPTSQVWSLTKKKLVGGLEHYLFFHILGII